MQNALPTRVLRVLSFVFALFASFYISSISSVSAVEYIAPDVNQRVKAATVMVHLEYQSPGSEHQVSWGTGFVIGDGLVMTNAHVVRDQEPIRIFIHNEYLPVTEAKIVAGHACLLCRFRRGSARMRTSLPLATPARCGQIRWRKSPWSSPAERSTGSSRPIRTFLCTPPCAKAATAAAR